MTTASLVAAAVFSTVATADGLAFKGGANLSRGEGSDSEIDNASIGGASEMNENVTLYFDRWGMSFDTESFVVPIIFAITFVLGLVGNGTLIVSVIANKVMCNIPNILIVSLSIGDFLLILISVPFNALIYTLKNWPFGEAMCKINEFTQTVSLGVTVFTLTALSADRYVAIVNPMAKLTGRTLRTTMVTVVGIWVVSILLALPDVVMSRTNEVPFNGTTLFVFCAQFDQEVKNYSRIYIILRFLVYFLLPMLTIGYFYVTMARILVRSSSSVPVDSKNGAVTHNRQMTARRKVAHVVLSFVIIFFVCWLPRHVFLIMFNLTEMEFNYFLHVFKIVGFCLTFINSCVNPFALYFLSGQFRKYYNRYLFCCCTRVRYDSLEPTSTMHNLHSASRRQSATNTSIVHSQSMC